MIRFSGLLFCCCFCCLVALLKPAFFAALFFPFYRARYANRGEFAAMYFWLVGISSLLICRRGGRRRRDCGREKVGRVSSPRNWRLYRRRLGQTFPPVAVLAILGFVMGFESATGHYRLDPVWVLPILQATGRAGQCLPA
ncbi:hypothetical protein KCP76_00460 [Salmonella enterica subsp. enterica serovar Weltevreden]|nr:hypothetical protein KCP76_00460 [Salmonella enterica subsp. enterica serovar Weltevreden]